MRSSKWLGIATLSCLILASTVGAQDKYQKNVVEPVDRAKLLTAPQLDLGSPPIRGAAALRNSAGFAGASPFGIAEDDSDQLFIGELFGGSVFIYDKDLGVVGSIPTPVGGTQTGMAYKNGSLFIIDGTASTFTEVDPSNGLPTGQGTIALPPVGGVPLYGPMTYDPDADTFWCEDIVSDLIFEMDCGGTLTGRSFQNPDDDPPGSGAFGNGLSFSSVGPLATIGTSVMDVTSGTLGEGQTSRISRGDPDMGGPSFTEIANITFLGDTFVNGIRTTFNGGVPVQFVVGNATNTIFEIGPPDPIDGPCGPGTVNIGTPPPFFDDDMESGDGNWTHGTNPATPNSLPDDWAIIATASACSGSAWFSADEASVKDVVLDSAVALAIPGGGATLRFGHTFNMEAGFDGCVLEASVDGGVFEDLGANITEGGYNSVISTAFGSPIGGREAWSGQVGPPCVSVSVDLTPFAGSTMVLRFRLACDSSVSDEGWYIDDVTVAEPGGGVVTNVLFVNRSAAAFCDDIEDLGNQGGGGGGANLFCDDMESGDANWTHGVNPATPNSLPDDWAIGAAPNANGNGWFSADEAAVKDVVLDLASFAVPAGGGTLSFLNARDMESGFDGCVLEISTDGGTTFLDQEANITAGGYDAAISTAFGSPIGGRNAWTGAATGTTEVDLSSFAGSSIIVRFRLACDSSVSDVGWTVDDVKIDEPAGAANLFCDDMESGDANWTHMVNPATPNSLPDDWAIGAAPNANANGWFSADEAAVKDVVLDLASFAVPAGGAELTFLNARDMESGFDGCVLEISDDGGSSFVDQEANITAGGYDAAISTAFGSPIGGRNAWTGAVVGSTTVDLSGFAGSSIIVRFRLACDSSVSANGWTIDDVKINEPMGGGGPSGGTFDNFTFSSPTANGDWFPVVHGGSNSPTHSWFSSDVAVLKDDNLDLNEFTVDASNASLSFFHNYNMETGFDGCVLEASLGGGAFFDLGNDIEQGGYDAVISTAFGSPIGGRSAWTGESGLPQTLVVVNLAPYAGQDIVVRWRLACDTSVSDEGWYVDDVKIGGSDGTGGDDRTVCIGLDSPICIELDAAPGGPAEPLYVFYAWVGTPDFDTVSTQPFGVGTTCMPSVISGGIPQPAFILNKITRFPQLGVSSINQNNVPCAPGKLINKPSGVSNPVVFTIQAILQDTFSAGDQPLTPQSDKPGSVSNAIIVDIK